MPKSRIILVIGFLIALLPVLGFPHSWESFFQVVGGLGIVALSVLISIDRRLSLKAKSERRKLRRRVRTEGEGEEVVGSPSGEQNEQLNNDTEPA